MSSTDKQALRGVDYPNEKRLAARQSIYHGASGSVRMHGRVGAVVAQ